VLVWTDSYPSIRELTLEGTPSCPRGPVYFLLSLSSSTLTVDPELCNGKQSNHNRNTY